MDRTRVIIDTDPGVDDAIAILLALASPELDVRAITTVVGNVSLEKTTRNARRLVELAQRRDVLVAQGCAEALAGPSHDASEVHGLDGLGNLEWAEPPLALHPVHAIEAQHAIIEDGPTTLIAIGPLTNLALLVDRYPDVQDQVQRVVMMGGASFEGNVTPAAEFNIWADPEAARKVFEARWPITMMPLDLTQQAVLNDDDVAYFESLGTDVGWRCARMLTTLAEFHERWQGTRDIVMHDAMAVYEVIDPLAITKQGVEVAIETAGEYSRGATWIDRRIVHAASSVRVGVRMDNVRFVALLRERLASYS